MDKQLALLLLLIASAHAQILQGIMNVQSGSAVIPGPFNWTVMDGSSFVNAANISAIELTNSTFAEPAGAAYGINGTAADLQGSSGSFTALFNKTVNLTHFGNYTASSPMATSFLTGGATSWWNYNFPSGYTGSSSYAFVIETDAAQTVTAYSRMDNATFGCQSGCNGDFNTLQIQNGSGTSTVFNVEESGGAGESTIGPNVATNTPYIIEMQFNPSSTSNNHYLGIWSWASSGTCSLVAYNVVNAISGTGTPPSLKIGSSNNVGPASSHVWFSQLVMSYTLAASSFPMVGGGTSGPMGCMPQLIPSVDSPGANNYPVAGTTVTLSDIANNPTPALCYTTDNSTPTASQGTCTHGTTYSSGFSLSGSSGTSTTLKHIASEATFGESSVVTSVYTYTSGPYGTAGSSTYTTGCTNATGCTYTIGNYTTGDFVLASACLQSTTATIAAPTDLAGNTYTVRETLTTGNGAECVAWTGSGGTTHSANTITIKPSTTQNITAVTENITQVGTGFDVASTMKANAASSAGTFSANAMTTGHTDYVWCWMYDSGGSGGTPTAGSGYALRYNETTWPHASEDQANVASGSVTGTFGWNTNHGFNGCLALF